MALASFDQAHFPGDVQAATVASAAGERVIVSDVIYQ